MDLRDHPLMCCCGMPNWPPIWVPAKRAATRVIAGEIGILRQINYDVSYNHRCQLVIEHESDVFVGVLLFDDISFCWLITNLLKRHIDRLIKDIGGLDLSYTL